jgi:hypothetical protein
MKQSLREPEMIPEPFCLACSPWVQFAWGSPSSRLPARLSTSCPTAVHTISEHVRRFKVQEPEPMSLSAVCLLIPLAQSLSACLLLSAPSSAHCLRLCLSACSALSAQFPSSLVIPVRLSVCLSALSFIVCVFIKLCVCCMCCVVCVVCIVSVCCV